MDKYEEPTIDLELRYTPRTVREIEDRAKQPLLVVVQDVTQTNLALLVRKGLNVDDNEADKQIQEYFDKGGDASKLLFMVINKLEEQGFLDRSLDLKNNLQTEMDYQLAEMKFKMMERKAQTAELNKKIASFGNIGESEKVTPLE